VTTAACMMRDSQQRAAILTNVDDHEITVTSPTVDLVADRVLPIVEVILGVDLLVLLEDPETPPTRLSLKACQMALLLLISNVACLALKSSWTLA
jgi:hypothetical protein